MADMFVVGTGTVGQYHWLWCRKLSTQQSAIWTTKLTHMPDYATVRYPQCVCDTSIIWRSYMEPARHRPKMVGHRL